MVSRFGYFPGCLLHSIALEYELSTKNMARTLNIELCEIPDWNCCGASTVCGTNALLDLALNGRNLTLASRLKMDLAVPCPCCCHRLTTARKTMLHSPDLQDEISKFLGKPLDLSSEVKSTLEIFTAEKALDKLQRTAKKSLSGLKVVAYYGCLLLRSPAQDQFVKNPTSMDKLVTALGGEAIPWPYKTECCGSTTSLTDKSIALTLSERILSMALECGAQCIMTACPRCQTNLDRGQKELAKKTARNFKLPILYFTQIMGLVLGLPYRSLGLNRQIIDHKPIFHQIGLL